MLTDDEILKMAREAAHPYCDPFGKGAPEASQLSPWHHHWVNNIARAAYAAGAAAEREACAKNTRFQTSSLPLSGDAPHEMP